MNPVRTVGLLAVCTVLLAACSSPTRSDGAGPAGAPTPAVSVSASPVKSEGPVSDSATVRYPNGLVVTLVKLDELDPKGGTDNLKPGHALIRTTISIQNTGAEAFQLPKPTTYLWTLFYGPNRSEAKVVSGWMGVAREAYSDDPTQVGAGQTVTIYDSSPVPVGELGVLAVQIHPGRGGGPVLPAFTFTDAQKLLRRR